MRMKLLNSLVGHYSPFVVNIWAIINKIKAHFIPGHKLAKSGTSIFARGLDIRKSGKGLAHW